MNSLSHLLSPEVMRLMALTLMHFLWQGTVLAAVAHAAMMVCRSASTRYTIAVALLAMMAAAPGITFLTLLQQDHATVPYEQSHVSLMPQPISNGRAPVLRKSTVPPRIPMPPYFMWLVEIWFAGVIGFSLRSAGGVLVVERLRRKESKPVSQELLAICKALQEKVAVKRVVNFCECVRLEAPAVAGWLRPVVMLPICTLTELNEEQLFAVIAHELAHIKRFDPLVNLFQVGVETLLFYHPAVWWLNKRIREERENCCDDIAVEVCGSPLAYAHALARMAESQLSPRLLLAANSRPLAARVARLLGIEKKSESMRGADLSLGVLCLSAALVAGGAFVGVAHNAQAQMPAVSLTVSTATDISREAVANGASVARDLVESLAGNVAASVKHNVEAAISHNLESHTQTTNPAPLAVPVTIAQASPVVGQNSASSYIDGLKAGGLENLTVDEIIGLKVQGVTPEYVKSMRELGLHVDADAIIGMKVQGITPEYVREMRAATGETLDADDLVGMKVQGITPEYVKEIHEMGLKADSGDLIGMKVQGVTPEYAREMQKVDPKLDAGELIGMRVQGITPEYVKEINALGLQPDAGELIGMKVQGVDAEYLKKMQAAGFKLDVGDAIEAKVMGVTPEFIEKARSHGFKNLTLHQLIGLKETGVLGETKQ
jgi:beta-lactamase regulating signal transducer with metallopeptidase domain